MVESAWLAPGTVETPASCLIGFYATVRTSGLAGFGPDAAVDFKLYADQGSGYALIGAQSVGINVTGGSAYFWLPIRSEAHTSELQSLMRISYAVFCLKTKTTDYTTDRY